MARDYSDIGLDVRLKPINGIAGRPNEFQNALAVSINQESTPYLHRTSVLNRGGTVRTGLGALIDFRDSTDGTSLITYTPSTGQITLNGPITSNGTTNIPNIGTVGTLIVSGLGSIVGPLVINNQGTINNRSLEFRGGTTNGTAAIRMFASAGSEVLTLGVSSDAFGYGTLHQLFFTSNTANSINESFGVVNNLADTAGAHTFQVRDSGGTTIMAMSSARFMELRGTRSDPGGGGAGVGRIFMQNNAAKDQIRAEFNTGVSVLIAAEP